MNTQTALHPGYWSQPPVMIKHKSIPPRKPALPMAKGTAITAEGAAKVKTVIPACLHPIQTSWNPRIHETSTAPCTRTFEIYCDDNSQRRSDCSFFDPYCWLFAKFDPSQSSRWSKVVSWPSSSISRRDEERPAITNDWLYFGVPFWHFNKKKMAAHGRQQINQRDSKTARGSGARTPTTSNSTTIEANFLANTSGRVNTRWVGSKCQRE